MLALTVAGAALQLLPERAIWYAAESALFVADLHWGKAAAFRAAYIPVPMGTTGNDLARLTTALTATNAQHLVVLGDLLHAREWHGAGFSEALKTPDNTLVFVTPAERATIRKDQADCMGCLSHCGFSSWKDHDDFTTGYLADPRSFCIQKTLQSIAHGGDVDQNLMFAGHNVYNFKRDPFYSNGFVPTVKQLVDRILTGD